MARKAEEAAAEKPAKRPRLIGALMKRDTAATFNNLNSDCLVHILSFLETEEMNDATLINSSFCEARNAPSLDQTRMAIIKCTSEEMTILGLFQTIESRNWATRVFSANGNKKVLKITGLDDCRAWGWNQQHALDEWLSRRTDFKLRSVTCLDISSPSTTNDFLRRSTVCISRILPNLLEANFRYYGNGPAPGVVLIREMCRFCPALCRLILDGSIVDRFPSHIDPENGKQIVDLYLNGTALRYDDMVQRDTNVFFWQHFPNLQRLDIQNVTHQGFYLAGARKPFSQEQLIKLVRNHPTLRWLKSDLTDVNMLKAERPDIALVNGEEKR